MTAKKRLLIYSDCYIYGGSERLLAFIIKNPIIREYCEIHFAYRRYRSYEVGLNEDYGSNRENFHPLFILSNDTLFHKIDTYSLPRICKQALKIPFWCLQKSGLYLLYNFLVMRSLIKKVRPHIVHINNGGYPAAQSCFAFVLAARAAGISSVVYQVNNIASLPKTRFSAWIDQEIVSKNVKYFITASQKAKDALVRNRNFPPQKIIALPNTTFGTTIVGGRDRVLKEFSLPQDSFLLCEVAFLSRRKGQIFLLKAVKDIESINPGLFKKLKLIFVGDGEDEKTLRKFAHDNELDSHVAFAGYRADRLDFISACDVFVLPSIASEDMPIVILEAMSMGKSIIASNFVGIKEELENGVSGILIEPDIKTLSLNIAYAIVSIYNNKETNTYGLNAKKRFKEYFSIEHYGHRLMEVFSQVEK